MRGYQSSGLRVSWLLVALFCVLGAFLMLPAVALAQVVPTPIDGPGPISFPQTFDTDLIMWSAIVAQVLPLAIARIQRVNMHHDARIAVAVAVCFCASLVTAFLLHKLDPANIATSLLIVFTLTSVMYKQVWKGSETIARLEAA